MSGHGQAAKPRDIVIVVRDAAKGPPLRPGPLHPVFYRPMLHYVLEAASAVRHRSIRLVIGSGEGELREQCRSYPDLVFVRDAAGSMLDAVRAVAAVQGTADGTVLLVPADAVLLCASSLEGLLSLHEAGGAACTVAAADAGTGEPTACCMNAGALAAVMARAPAGGAQTSGGLAEVVAALEAPGGKAGRFPLLDRAEAIRVTDPFGLSEAERVLQERRNRALMLAGVLFKDPRTAYIDSGSRIAAGARIGAGCTVLNSVIAAEVLLEDHCRVVDSEIGGGSRVKQGTSIEESRIGRGCRVGPYARLRAGAELDDDVWVGNFVEVKASSLGSGTRAAHLSFIGDARVGRNVNIGCGFITCNTSGLPLKQRTVIEDDVFIGSASQAIAPVTLGTGSFIATGTSVSEDVPPGAFAISRGRQVTKPGYAKKYGRGSGSTKLRPAGPSSRSEP